MSARAIVLIGPMGAGKTSVGRRVARALEVPFADTDTFKVPDHLTDEQLLFLSDILPTGYMAAENCNIQKGDVVAVWGCGPVGQFAVASAYLLGAERVIAIDRVPERLQMAAERGGAVPLNYEKVDSVVDALIEMTGGRGPDSCIDAVGMEAHAHAAAADDEHIRRRVQRHNAHHRVALAQRQRRELRAPHVVLRRRRALEWRDPTPEAPCWVPRP